MSGRVSEGFIGEWEGGARKRGVCRRRWKKKLIKDEGEGSRVSMQEEV